MLFPFPQSTEIRKKSKQRLTLIDVCCKCRAPFFESGTDKNPGLYMIERTVCKERFYKKCEVKGYPIFVLEITKKCGSVFFVNNVYIYIFF